jgi:hypothetical protein
VQPGSNHSPSSNASAASAALSSGSPTLVSSGSPTLVRGAHVERSGRAAINRAGGCGEWEGGEGCEAVTCTSSKSGTASDRECCAIGNTSAASVIMRMLSDSSRINLPFQPIMSSRAHCRPCEPQRAEQHWHAPYVKDASCRQARAGRPRMNMRQSVVAARRGRRHGAMRCEAGGGSKSPRATPSVRTCCGGRHTRQQGRGVGRPYARARTNA